MRVLASADVHGKRPVYDWLLTVAQEHHVEAIVLAGDLLGCLDGFETPEQAQRHEAAMLIELLETAGAPVLYIMGNDDLIELDSGSDRVRSIHGRKIACGRFTFVGYQYSLPFTGGPFEKPDADIRIDLACLPGPFDAGTVFVSHSPAFGILDPGFGDAKIGSRSLRKFLQVNPLRAHIHGHSHAGFGRKDSHFNVASAGRARAMIIDLETLQHQLLGSGPLSGQEQT
jgi:Icc-related predicted phosphoesterase